MNQIDKRAKLNHAFHHFLDMVPDPLLTVNEDLLIIMANREAHQRWPLLKEGETLFTGLFPCPGIRTEDCILVKTFQSKKSLADVVETKDGEFFEIKTNYIDEQGETLAFVHIQDISRRRQIEILTQRQRDLAQKLGEVDNLEAALRFCLLAAIEVSGMDSGGVYLLDKENGSLKLLYSQGLSPAFVERIAYLTQDSPNVRLVMEKKPQYKQYKKFLPQVKDETRDEEGLRFLAVVPILHEGKVIACLNIGSHILERLDQMECHALETVAAQVGGVIVRLQAEEELRASEGRYRTLQTNIPLGAYRSTLYGKIVSVNPAMVKMFGYESAEEMLTVPATDLYVSIQKREELIQVLTEKGVVTGYESQMRRKDGSPFWCSLNLKGVTDAEGKIIHQDGIIEDITARKKSEEELLKAEKLSSLGLLAGGIAHDFNNILASVMVNITLARMNIKKEQKALAKLSDAEKALSRAKDLTRQLLTFSMGGAPIRNLASVDSLLRDTVDFMLSGSKIRGEFQIADNLYDVEIDEGQISQVVQNLLINAQEAMPSGGVVEIKAENVTLMPGHGLPLKDGDYIRVSIIDQGIGIPADHLNKIFDPFFTTKHRGSGLGLSTAYSVVKTHNGFITVESELGKGSIFYFYLPASKKKKDKADAPMLEMAAGQGKILLMDDEEIILQATGELLEEMGYAVVTTHGGEEAIRLYEEARQTDQPFDLVIMDLIVPGAMGGKDALQELLKRDPQVRAVASSGYSTDPIMGNYQEYGFVAALSKPYKIRELYIIVQEAINPQSKS